MLHNVFMFSGQGSHYFGMAHKLYQSSPVFRETADRLDAQAARITGCSALGRLYEAGRGSGEPFKETLQTHPAIFIVQYALMRLLGEAGIEPALALGVSLGEFCAAVCAGVLEPEAALEAVVVQAQLIERHCPAGGMLAVIHDPALYRATPLLHDRVELAGVSYPGHFVVSGSIPDLDRVRKFLEGADIMCLPLPVGHAFHSQLIDRAAAPYADYLGARALSAARLPWISCLTGGPAVPSGPGFFWDAVRRPMRFREALRGLESSGPWNYLDLGPGGTLANFCARNLGPDSASTCSSLSTPFHQERENLERWRLRFATPQRQERI